MKPVFFVKRDLILFLEEFHIFSFVWHNKTKRTSLSCNSCSSTNSVNVFFDIAAEVPLDNPSDTFKIQASRSDISANKHRFFSLVKSKIVLLSLFLLHVSVQLLNITVKKQLLLLCSASFNRSFFILVDPSSTLVPIKFQKNSLQKVNCFTIADENNCFLTLVAVKKGQEVD